MEVYVLDPLLRREHVIDRFESLIWTERWQGYGDFEIVINSTRENRAAFRSGTRLSMNESYRVMTVENVENGSDEDGSQTLIVKGRSLESILEDRVAKKTMSNTTVEPVWKLAGKPADIARTIFSDICRLGKLSPDDVIPFLMPGTLFAASTIPEPVDPITWEQDIDTVYKALKDICEMYDLGFRLVRNFDASQLYFDVYSGSDRTTKQTNFPPVVFAPELDNLQNTTEFSSIEDTKNVAYVFSSQGFEVVFGAGVATDVEGFDRRVISVKADDYVAPEGVDITAAAIKAHLIQKGREELSKHRSYQAFDGELNQFSTYRYNVHYNLGDLVEIRNADGFSNNMRVTEQIFVSDKEGERSYPTLALDLFINPGSWLSWNFNQVWADLGPTEYWSTV